MPVEPLAGKVVIDTANYYPQRDGVIPELEDESTTTSERFQAHVPGAKVVKGFNNIRYTGLATLARPSGAADRTALPIAGDDEAAKAAVAEFFDRIGYDTVDVGPLAEGWRFQRDEPAYVTPYGGPGGIDDPRPGSAADRPGEAGRSGALPRHGRRANPAAAKRTITLSRAPGRG